MDNSSSLLEGREELLPLSRDIDGDTYSIAESDDSGDESEVENHLAGQYGSESSIVSHSTTMKPERLRNAQVWCLYV